MNTPREEQLFELALEKSVEKRATFLDAVCGDDSGLRERIEALLAAHEQESGFLPDDAPTESAITLLDESALTEGAGTQIGRYKLLEKLGEGGFGSVWAAEQKEPVRRRVALKIIKLGMDTKQVVARFEAERQALALMDHPNIAKVLDAGATNPSETGSSGRESAQTPTDGDQSRLTSAATIGVGRPYFVMELVKGIAITKYCDQEKLDTNARLDLFIKVCQAIQHAHQKGIIHRDIKPSNIMVTLHDGVPVPKVIDFGIAKATQQELTEKTIYTQYSQFIGTPAYMSPEQAEMSGLDIDTRSDIYSLGVLLYELLTGSTPFDSKELMQSGLDEMRKIIREREPVRPSTRLSQTMTQGSDSKPPLATRHSTLASDLDWIVMKCLEKDRTRRYDTAKGVASDINRHLSNEPIIARPPSAAYKFQKSWRRNKLAYGAATIVLATLVCAAVVSGIFAVREHSAREAESVERFKAEAAGQVALTSAQRNFRLSYMSDVNLAHRILQSGDLSRATSLLKRYLPEEGTDREDLRGFEWYYLWSQCHGRSARVLPHQGVVRVTFSPDGRTFATGGSDGVIRIRDTKTLVEIRKFEINPDPFGQYQSIQPIYSPRGGIIAGLHREDMGDDSGTVKLCDVKTGSTWSLANSSTNTVVQIAFAKDGETLMTAEHSGKVRHWDVASGQPVGEPTQLAMKAEWHRAAFSTDNRLLAVAAREAISDRETSDRDEQIEIQIYDLETGRVRVTPTSVYHFGELKFTQESRFLAGTRYASDASSIIWDLETGQEIFSATDIVAGAGIAVLSSETIAIGGSDSIRFVHPESHKEVERWDGIPGIVFGLAASPDGKHLASAGWDGVVRLWDLPKRENPTSVRLNERGTDRLSFSPSGKLLAAERKGAVILRDSETFETIRRLDDQRHPVFSPTGERLATIGSTGDKIHFWDSRSGQPDGLPISMDGEQIVGITFSRDGTLIGCSNTDGAITILEVATRRIDQRIAAPLPGTQSYLAFGINSQGETLLAIPAARRKVKLLNLNNAAEKTLEGSTPDIWNVSFSPDGSRLASTGSGTIIWNTTTGHRELVIDELTSNVVQASFTPDGKSLLIRAYGGGVGLWDLQTGREKIRLHDIYNQSVQSVAFSPDGNRIIAGINNDTLMIWTATRE